MTASSSEYRKRVYTKFGDLGETSLLYGGRVSKNNPHSEAYGITDEAVSAMGLARALTGPVPAVAFVANRSNAERYTGRLPDQVVARYIAEACGEGGSGAEYLLETVLALDKLRLRDSRLWRLQRMVAGHLTP